MANKSPVFPMVEPQHFSDYGFDPQFDYFQVLEEARKHKREAPRSIDSLHFRLQKPISKDDTRKGSKKKRHWWWKNALFFFKSKWASPCNKASALYYYHHQNISIGGGGGGGGGGGSCRSPSGPIYVTESLSGCSTPYRTTSRPLSSPLAGTLTPSRKGDLKMPYFSLKDLSMDQPHGVSISSPMPIYLVT
ncbi:hypothetical protein Cgig2_019080 [Carnegiea gigantea]|uniref:Uncharacterized protein n=1 Tax=Carnegiea gigantea TaxID=171969 RepID=A0A9Q1KF42_9CARY|nr:hypothetical protein Cgig2_019080 [Carnegiea gigantea]